MKILNKSVALALISLITASCASTHPGQMGTFEKGDHAQPLKLSAEVQSKFSDDHYTFVTFTVENVSDDMLRVKSTDLDLLDAGGSSSVLVGSDLVAWATAEQEEQEKEKHNKKIAQLILLLGGAGLGLGGGLSHNNTMEATGLGVMAGASAWSLSSNISDSVTNAKNPKKVPEEHIYAPFAVPAGKFVRKWAVIQHPPKNAIHDMNLTITLEDGSEATYAIHTK
jgi:hypothetical protein